MTTVSLEYRAVDLNGVLKTEIIAQDADGKIIHIDQLNLARADARKRFAETLTEKCPDLDRDVLDARLLDITAAMRERSEREAVEAEAAAEAEKRSKAEVAERTAQGEPVRPKWNLSDQGNGERLAAKFGDRVRFCDQRGRFFETMQLKLIR